ncbi:MAG TPA: hypothetical protein VE860_16580, partial [Chthoniobacterales bacterium]|nr:hypothetical protein [Chthoniobacterales bacterium]
RKFRCFLQKEFKTVCFHPLFQNRLMNRRAASIHEPAITALPRILCDFCGLACIAQNLSGFVSDAGSNPLLQVHAIWVLCSGELCTFHWRAWMIFFREYGKYLGVSAKKSGESGLITRKSLFK